MRRTRVCDACELPIPAGDEYLIKSTSLHVDDSPSLTASTIRSSKQAELHLACALADGHISNDELELLQVEARRNYVGSRRQEVKP